MVHVMMGAIQVNHVAFSHPLQEARPWAKPVKTIKANITYRGSTRFWPALVCGAHFMSTMIVRKSGNQSVKGKCAHYT